MEEISTRINQGCNSIDCYKMLIDILGTRNLKHIKKQICDQPNVMRDLENFITEGNEGIIGGILSSRCPELIQQLINTNSEKSTEKSIFLQKLEGFINTNNINIIGRIMSSRCPELIRQLIGTDSENSTFLQKLKGFINGENESSKSIIEKILSSQKSELIQQVIEITGGKSSTFIEKLKNFINNNDTNIIGRIVSSGCSELIQQVIEVTGGKSSTFIEKLKNFINSDDTNIIRKIVSSQSQELIRRLINEKDCNFIGKLQELIMDKDDKIIGSLKTNIRYYRSINELRDLIKIIGDNKTKKRINFTDDTNAMGGLYEEHQHQQSRSTLSVFSAVKDRSIYQVEDSSSFDSHILSQPMVQQPFFSTPGSYNYTLYSQPIVQQQYVYQPTNINISYQFSYPQPYYPSYEQPQTFIQTDLHNAQLQEQRAKLETKLEDLTSSETEFEPLEESLRKRKTPETNNYNTHKGYSPKRRFDDSKGR